MDFQKVSRQHSMTLAIKGCVADTENAPKMRHDSTGTETYKQVAWIHVCILLLVSSPKDLI